MEIALPLCLFYLAFIVYYYVLAGENQLHIYISIASIRYSSYIFFFGQFM